jgi:hypothetical protein
MMSPEKSDRELLQETHDSIIELTAVVLGVKGQGGLIQDLTEVKMSVTDMVLKHKEGDIKVASLLSDLVYLKPKVAKLDDEIHKDNGICDKLNSHEDQLKTSSNIMKVVWGITGALLLSLLGLLIKHILEQ